MKSIIQLTKTSSGFSIVQNGVQVNRVMNKSPKQKQFSMPKKFSQQSFTIYPYLYNKGVQEDSQKYLILPAKSQWFNLNHVHEIQKKALPQWFKTRKVIFGAVKPDKFQKNQDLYRKYRNYIIELGKKSYVSPTQARKGMAGDACAIIRIHTFLEQWGLINYVYPKQTNNKQLPINPPKPSMYNKNQAAKTRNEIKDCIDKDKTIIDQNYDKDYLELLKKVTKKVRPICQFCKGICGVVWYEYEDKLFLKTFKQKEENQKIYIETSTDPFVYTLRLCASCLYNGNIPVIFSMDNFNKKSLIQKTAYYYEEPKDKKKTAQQNRMLEAIEKNKFNIKKCSQILKIDQSVLYQSLMSIPLVKIQKMSRIDQDTDTEQEQQQNQQHITGLKQQNQQKLLINGHSHAQDQQQNDIIHNLQECITDMNQQQIELYQKFIQSWLLKIMAKMDKLSSWEKSARWFTDEVLNSQKNKIAELIKKS